MGEVDLPLMEEVALPGMGEVTLPGMEEMARQYGFGGYVECCQTVVDPLFLLTIIAGNISNINIISFYDWHKICTRCLITHSAQPGDRLLHSLTNLHKMSIKVQLHVLGHKLPVTSSRVHRLLLPAVMCSMCLTR